MLVKGTDIAMIRGDSESITVSCTAEDGRACPFQMGDTVYFTLKKSEYGVEKVLQKVETNFLDGKAVFRFGHQDTCGLPFGAYRYDVQLTGKDGRVTTIVPPSFFRLCEEVTYE